jgi:hypothetical protein
MSREEKQVQRLLSLPKDFTIDELTTLLIRLGYRVSNKGATSGSRIAFINDEIKDIIRIHKPHPKKEVGIATLKDVVSHLQEKKLL